MRRVCVGIVSLVLAFGATACNGAISDPAPLVEEEDPANEPDASPSSNDDVGEAVYGGTAEPTPETLVDPETVFKGKYELSTYLDLAESGVFGEYISGALVSLSEFHENPAETILDLMALYDLSYYSIVWNAIPEFLKDYFTEWLDDLVFEAIFDAVPAVEQVVQIIDDIASVSRNVEMVSMLELGAVEDDGHMDGTHALSGLAFTLWGIRTVIDVPSDASDTKASPGATLTELDSPIPTIAQGLLEIEDHELSVPYGEMLLSAVAELIYTPLGASSLGDLLNILIDCGDIANALVDMCAWDACLGDYVSKSNLEHFCESGLDGLGWVVELAIGALKFDELHLDDGKCQMFDEGYDDTEGDKKIDSIQGGSWDTSVKIGWETFEIDSWFEGHPSGGVTPISP